MGFSCRVFGALGNLYLWAKIAPPTFVSDSADPGNNRYVPAERIVGMGVDVVGRRRSPTRLPTRLTIRPSGGTYQLVRRLHLTLRFRNSLVQERSPRFRRGAVLTLGMGGIVSILIVPPAGTAYDVDSTNVIGADGNVYMLFATIPVALDTLGTTSVFLAPESGGRGLQHPKHSHVLRRRRCGRASVSGGGGIQMHCQTQRLRTFPKRPAWVWLLCGLGLGKRRRSLSHH